jgi:hypothetical protein
MELDDLKNSWNNLSHSLENQQHLTSQIIDQMTQKKYNSKINKIAYPEIIGVIISLLSAVFIGVNFYKLDSLILQGAGILAVLLLLTISATSLLSLRRFSLSGDVNKPYAETLKLFATQKLQFLKMQKLNVTLSYLLLVTVIILMSKFFNGKDITESKYFWIFSFTFGYIFLLFYTRVVSRFYRNTLRQAEELLAEVQPK